ncbi:MAG: hypothetical protein E6248_13785 [Clostridium sp.]|nr:hypothetical protein [Clostridium sp.]
MKRECKYNLLSNDNKYDVILCADKFIKIDNRYQIQIDNDNLTDEEIY